MTPNFNDLKPTREDANVAISALRALMTLNEVFPDLIPASYATLHTRLFHTLSVRDLVKNEFPARSSDLRGPLILDGKDQFDAVEQMRVLLKAAQ